MQYIQTIKEEITRYCSEQDQSLREEIYNQSIKSAFEESVAHMIEVYNFGVPQENIEKFKQDCVEYLHQKLQRYQPKIQTKHFSYFNVIIKCWMTAQRRNYK